MRWPKHLRPYYSLVVLIEGTWGIEFGDYDLEAVTTERDDWRDKGWKAEELKIITTTDQLADIDRVVFELNEALRK